MKSRLARRDFGKVAIAGISAASIALRSSSVFAATKPNSKIDGVQLGAQTYSFRDLDTIDQVLNALVTIGLSSCELFSPGIEPGGAPAVMGNISKPAHSRWPTSHTRTDDGQLSGDAQIARVQEAPRGSSQLAAHDADELFRRSPEEIQ